MRRLGTLSVMWPIGEDALFTQDDLDRFHEAVQTMKLYRRAELESPQGVDLIDKLYVDPLPNEHVHKVLTRPNTTFLIGRKGTGKSTIFLRAQKTLHGEKDVISAYVDIKTVYESAQIDQNLLANLSKEPGALPPASLQSLLLMTAFMKAIVAGIREDLQKQLKNSWKLRVREAFTGTLDDLSYRLDSYIAGLSTPTYIDVQGVQGQRVSRATQQGSEDSFTLGVEAALEGAAKAAATMASHDSTASRVDYGTTLLRILDVKELISSLKHLLSPLGIKRLYVFVDDFSELPEDAMRSVVDALIAPLNNWSDELLKFKIAAYPGRIYYGAIDKTKIDEVDLDLFNLYGQSTVNDMEVKGVDFTRRLVEKRLRHFGLDCDLFISRRSHSKPDSGVWEELFNASLGNPRTLGYILVFLHENQLIYGRQITVTGVKDAAKRYYEDKVEPYFHMGKFLHETFAERSSIFSLRELLESLVQRARDLREKESASVFAKIDGRHPTSHFNVSPSLEPILSSLELNFFLTKYYEMSDRDGRRVSVYALNYGLCEKYSIAFGRPNADRSQRLYFVERVFDYNSILQEYIARNQEISCGNCGATYGQVDLEALKKFHMLCPACRVGECRVSNISRKYADVLQSVREEELLPATELGILQTLGSQGDGLYASDIAGELDVSYQLVGKRAKRLDEMKLLDRVNGAGGRREYRLTNGAKTIYFEDGDDTGLSV